MRIIFKQFCFSIIFIILFNLSALSNTAYQDSLKISLQQAEKLFIDSNYYLLAANYNIDAQKALIEQAKLWDNPILVTDQNIYSNNKFFEHGKDLLTGNPIGQYFIQIQQLIKTAGKRSKLINIATTNASITELQFKDLMRTLRFQLRTDYYQLVQLIDNQKILLSQQMQLDKLLASMDQQLIAGNIAQKEQLRIRSLVISLQQDITEINKQIADTQSDIKILLRISNNSYILPSDPFKLTINPSITLEQLTIAAKQNNPYYQIQLSQNILQQQNLLYQKSLKSPDLIIGPEYDLNSNYTPKYFGLSVSLPLPVLNRNQGNIKSAKFGVKQQEQIVFQSSIELDNQLMNTYNKWLLNIKQNGNNQTDFYNKYELLFNKMRESYQQRQIGLLEFLDFFNNYQDAKQRLLQQKYNLQQSEIELNYFVGTDILK